MKHAGHLAATVAAAAVTAATTITAIPAAANPPAPPPGPPCNAADGYICGQQGPEDLVAMGADWAVASAYTGTGGVTVIRLKDRTSLTVYPSSTAKEKHDTKTYPECLARRAAHSPRTASTCRRAAARRTSSSRWVMARANRSRCSTSTPRGATPVLTWVGCVIAPMPIGLNSVRSLPDGGFLTTNFLPRGANIQTLFDGVINGELWEWHTKSGWQKVPGSETSGANGVELSDDGKTIYMASWGSRSFIRLSRGAKAPKREEIKLGFQIDNIHWAKDGTLLGAGQVGQDWRVVKIHPQTLKVDTIYSQDDKPGFGGGTVALEVGDALWVGSYRGDRIAIVPRR